MTQLFREMRMTGHTVVFFLGAGVLGLAAYLASVLKSSDLHHSFVVLVVVTASLTVAAFLLLYVPELVRGAEGPSHEFGYGERTSWSRPVYELPLLFIFAVLWLASASWSADILGNIQCDAIPKSQRIPTKSGSISAKAWCYEMRIIEALSWIQFALFAIFVWILITLTSRAKAFGRYGAWWEPIVELPWFGQYPGYPMGEEGSPRSGRYRYAYPASSARGSWAAPPSWPYESQPQMVGGAQVIPQQPGHAVVIRPSHGGRPAVIEQVPA
ncbi:MARVEL domain-containing protein [Phanerochaete sordida]|uniref:MARVEL domain-containing protein n=1 Tax=Phanerochaete sordida TaxID=48140 RepID=A0A9P3G587_9APHY|nr:MARVEL domain-containing protein [Phanerochaete sordida]